MTRKKGSKIKLSATAGVKSLSIKIDNSPKDIIEDVEQSSHCSRSMPVSTCHSTTTELMNCATTVDKISADTPVFKVN